MERKKSRLEAKEATHRYFIGLDAGIILLAVIVSIVVCSKQHTSFAQFKAEFLTVNPMSIAFAGICVHIIYCFLYCRILRHKRNTIIQRGTRYRGKIIGVNNVVNPAKQSSSISNYCSYTLKLSDGRTITTNAFYEDYYDELVLHECNVYEHEGKFAFVDFE